MTTHDSDIRLALDQFLARPNKPGDWERVLRDAQRNNQRFALPLLSRIPGARFKRLGRRKRVARQDLLALEAYEAPALGPDALGPYRHVVAGDRAVGRAL